MEILLKIESCSWLNEIFYSWNLILQNKSSVGDSVWDKLFSCSIQLFDYFFSRLELKSAYSVYPFCGKFYSFHKNNRHDDMVDVLIKVAYLSIDLGHSGKAGQALSSAKIYIQKVGSNTKFRFHSCYANYLISIGNYDKANEIYLKFSNSECNANDILLARLELSRYRMGNAGEICTSVYHRLFKKLKNCSSVSLYSLYQFFKVLHLLCVILMLQGLPLKLDYYFEQGLIMAKKLSSKLSGPILIELARFLKMKHDFNSSLKQIQNVKDEFHKVRSLLFNVFNDVGI